MSVTQGVPQGSALGPLFYIIYANDLTQVVKHCKIALYADDTVLYTANANFERSVAKIQKDLDFLSRCCKNNRIYTNTEKTKVMVFDSAKRLNELPTFSVSFDDTPLQQTLTYKYLGIDLDRQLNYDKHVNKIVSTVTNKLKQFQRMRSFLKTKAAVLVYKSMILPIIE